MDKFMMNGLKNLGEDWIKHGMGTNESKPASVPAKDKQHVSKEYTAINSDGPWIKDAAKKGSGGTDDVKKIWKMADNRDYMCDAGKTGKG